jgi:hypothetical protein
LKFLLFLAKNPTINCDFSPTITPRDGNCLLHAISDGILNNDAFKHNSTMDKTGRWCELLKELRFFDDSLDEEEHIQYLRSRWVLVLLTGSLERMDLKKMTS